jgi:hypothetical protein
MRLTLLAALYAHSLAFAQQPSSHGPSELGSINATSLIKMIRAPACASAGGICTVAFRCQTEIKGDASKQCAFSDGPGVCCEAPPLRSGPKLSCAATGGVCAPLAGCSFVDGALAAGRCAPRAPGVACCVPKKNCPDSERYSCCDADDDGRRRAWYRPICDGDIMRCPIKNTILRPTAECEAAASRW